mmetsp:Transcript_32749/g.74807  ORF Transcript_32749/g.74807 Transcript_32749/m.74807 type:complete len:326 (-) Transcript_32749:503-1480(-)
MLMSSPSGISSSVPSLKSSTSPPSKSSKGMSSIPSMGSRCSSSPPSPISASASTPSSPSSSPPIPKSPGISVHTFPSSSLCSDTHFSTKSFLVSYTSGQLLATAASQSIRGQAAESTRLPLFSPMHLAKPWTSALPQCWCWAFRQLTDLPHTVSNWVLCLSRHSRRAAPSADPQLDVSSSKQVTCDDTTEVTTSVVENDSECSDERVQRSSMLLCSRMHSLVLSPDSTSPQRRPTSTSHCSPLGHCLCSWSLLFWRQSAWAEIVPVVIDDRQTSTSVVKHSLALPHVVSNFSALSMMHFLTSSAEVLPLHSSVNSCLQSRSKVRT